MAGSSWRKKTGQNFLWALSNGLKKKENHKSVNYDRPGDCSPEKDCLRWHWLTFRQPERKSSSESSELWIVSRCLKFLVVAWSGQRLLRTKLTQMIVIYRLMMWLLGSNHIYKKKIEDKCTNKFQGWTERGERHLQKCIFLTHTFTSVLKQLGGESGHQLVKVTMTIAIGSVVISPHLWKNIDRPGNDNVTLTSLKSDESCLNPQLIKYNEVYKITKILRALWLAERCVCMRVCKHQLWCHDPLRGLKLF